MNTNTITNANAEILSKIQNRLNSFTKLKEGWRDGCGSTFSQEWIDSIFTLIKNGYPDDLPKPLIGPNGDGGICLEWRNDGTYYTMDIESNHPEHLKEIIMFATNPFQTKNKTHQHKIDLTSRKGWKEVSSCVLKKHSLSI